MLFWTSEFFNCTNDYHLFGKLLLRGFTSSVILVHISHLVALVLYFLWESVKKKQILPIFVLHNKCNSESKWLSETSNRSWAKFEWIILLKSHCYWFTIFSLLNWNQEGKEDSFKYNEQDAMLYNILYYSQCSTCFGRFLRPSSGAQELYTQHLVCARIACCYL